MHAFGCKLCMYISTYVPEAPVKYVCMYVTTCGMRLFTQVCDSVYVVVCDYDMPPCPEYVNHWPVHSSAMCEYVLVCMWLCM
jgi:hypothetical protein